MKQLTIILISLFIISGCSTTPKNPDDPWEDWNRSTQNFNDGVDDYVLNPLATGYIFITPQPVDTGITNFFSNIDDVSVTINNLLQAKFVNACSDFARFLINTTAGVGGFIDVATMIDLTKHNEDFGQTLAVWGVPQGPYLVLPFAGPSSPRGTGGLVGDVLLDPITYTVFGNVTVRVIGTAAKLVRAVDQRAGFKSTVSFLDEAAFDRYSFIKNSYLQNREYLIMDGNVPDKEPFDPFIDYEE